MKIGWLYFCAILAGTLCAVVVACEIEVHNKKWVLEHPILDGSIGGAIVIPITGVIALVVIDQRLAARERKDRLVEASAVAQRLGLPLRQAIRAGLYGMVVPRSPGTPIDDLDVAGLQEILRTVRTWDSDPDLEGVRQTQAIMGPYIGRSVDLMRRIGDLGGNPRAKLFADFIEDGSDFLRVNFAFAERTTAGDEFWLIFAVITEMLVNAADELCHDALPLALHNGSFADIR